MSADQHQQTTVYGRLEPFFETGTEGIQWSMQETSIPSYGGLWTLEKGDHLKVLDGDGDVLWDGIIKLEYKRNWERYPSNPEYGQQAVRGFWVHGLQDGLEPDIWANMFFNRHRAILTLGKKHTRRGHGRKVHPFVGSSADMETRLRALPDEPYYESSHYLYHQTAYSWLSFYSDGKWHSLAQDWEFTLDETLRLIGSPTAEQVEVWKTYPKRANDTLMPFEWSLFTRLALLYGVWAGLDWIEDKNERVIHAQKYKALLLRPGIEGISQVRDLVYPIYG